MAIHGQQPENNSISATFGAGGQAKTEQPQEQQKQTKASFSWNSLHSFSNHAMTRSPLGEVLVNTLAALEEQLKTHKMQNYEVKLIPLDMKDFSRLPTSCIVIALKDKTLSKSVVSVHTLILEGSVTPWPDVTEVINGQNVIVKRPTSVAVKTGIEQIVAEEVNRIYPNATLLSAEAEVVPRDFDLKDTARVYSLAANALLATESRLFEHQGRPELNLANASNDSSLSLRTSFISGQEQQLDAVGLPIRSDIEISITSKNTQQQLQQQNQYNGLLERQRDIGYVTGYVDTYWDPVQQQGGYAGFQNFQTLAPDGSLPTAKYRAMFVITDNRIQELSSLTSQIFSLLPARLLLENNSWHQGFRPRAVSKGVNSKNVGALNIEANLPLPINNNQPDPNGRGPKLDIDAASFNEQDFHNYMQAIFRPGLAVAIDCQECGSSTWNNNIFTAVALGIPEAYNELYDATDYLTNGNFSKLFPRGEVMVSHYTTVHNGWYVDQNGVRRDIRDFDLVALLNHPTLSENKAAVDAWINSFQNTQQPIKMRLHDRFRILDEAFSEIQLTGFSNRNVFSDNYLSAVLKASAQCGLTLPQQNQFSEQGFVTRVSGSLNANMFGMGGGTSVFTNHNAFGGNNNNNAFGGFAGRFGWSR